MSTHVFNILWNRQEVCRKHFCYLLDHSGRLKEHHRTVNILNGSLVSWNITFTWKNDWMAIQTWAFGQQFLENEQSEPLTSWTSENMCCQWWNLSFQVKTRILEILYPPLWTGFPILKDISDAVGSDYQMWFLKYWVMK